ncbi:MAG: extracellular solute-binding protein family 1, partial [Clostridiales bacterium]|nr:extracellular solute-binding protein family 1 [Clostridiales bacterium]
MNQKVKKMIAMFSMVAMATAFVAGCGKKDKGTESSVVESKEPFKITGLNQTYGDAPAVDNRIVKEIETYTNTKLDITWAPAASYNDKFVMTIASGEMPMFMLITDDKHSAYLGALKQGAFWEIGPYLKDYPALNSLSKAEWDNSKYEGKNYLVPRWRPIARNGILYRKDWADAAGLKEPTNTDELYTMIKTFGTGDYDKNGKTDTTGFVLDSNFGKYQNDVISYITSVFGASTSWGLDTSGKIVPNYAEKEYLDALKWLRKLYSEKLINQDFAMLQNGKQTFAKGNTGV